MDYVAPIGGDPGDPYVDANPGTGQEGSPVSAAAIEHPMREIVAAIEAAGLTPDGEDLTQLTQAIEALIVAGLPSIAENRVFLSEQTFEGTVADGNPVRWDAGNSRWKKAQAGTADRNAGGFADVTGGEVTIYGEHDVGLSGLTPGAPQYLSDATPGALTETAPDGDRIRMGVAKSATVVFVDIDQLGAPPLLQGRRMFSFDASALRPVETGGGDPIEGAETTAGRPDVVGVCFDFATETAYQFYWVLPPSVDPASLTFRFHVAEADGGASQHTARIGVQGISVGNDETMDAAYGTAQEVTVELGTLEDHYDSAETAALTLAGTPAAGELCVFRIYRNHDHGDDDLDVRLQLLAFDVFASIVAGNDA